MSSDKHTALIKTPRQLITVVILAFLVPVVLIILLASYVASQKVGGAGSDAMTPEAIAERLRPVGYVAFASTPSGPRPLQSGEAVYKLACSACHATGAAGAPKAGDTGAWSARIKQGYDTLVKHAVEGYKGMPAKGGNPDLDPIEVARGVAFIANQAGAKFKEPDAPAAAPAKGTARSGEQIVQTTCGNCHNTGLHGAPKIGDRAAWTKRVSNGVDAVAAAAIKGHGGMPARGGMADLTDAELKSAVQYMFSKSVGPAAATSAAPVAAATTTAATAAAPASKPDGAQVYARGCNACHATGVAGAPKYGDKVAWAPRSKAGVDALVASVLKGKGAMPPKGGQAAASDAEIRAAVEYLLAAAK
ncbi:MAG TPA: c-type cytochrome [Burkholderiaceae bacterium]|nr:c-type cytochrome [Burkholderiaceae bacterium]